MSALALAPAPPQPRDNVVPLRPRKADVAVSYLSASMDAPDREQVLFGPTLRQALNTILRRLEAGPAEIVAERLSGGAIGLSRRRADGYLWLVAVVTAGPSANQVVGGLAALDREGWRP